MTVIDPEKVHLALRGTLLTIAELPALRAWDNVSFTPSATAASIEDALGTFTTRRRTAPAALATVEATGLYVIKVYGVANRGDSEIREMVTAIVDAFPLGGTATLDSGDVVRIDGEGGHTVSQILPISASKTQCTITIPWLVYGRNPASVALAS